MYKASTRILVGNDIGEKLKDGTTTIVGVVLSKTRSKFDGLNRYFNYKIKNHKTNKRPTKGLSQND